MPDSLSQHSHVAPVTTKSQECPKCQGPMMLSRIVPGRLKFDVHTFECIKCERVENVLLAIDPMQSDVLGWFLGDLRTPT